MPFWFVAVYVGIAGYIWLAIRTDLFGIRWNRMSSATEAHPSPPANKTEEEEQDRICTPNYGELIANARRQRIQDAMDESLARQLGIDFSTHRLCPICARLFEHAEFVDRYECGSCAKKYDAKFTFDKTQTFLRTFEHILDRTPETARKIAEIIHGHYPRPKTPFECLQLYRGMSCCFSRWRLTSRTYV